VTKDRFRSTPIIENAEPNFRKARLRRAGARELVRALEKAGFDIIYQKGSHITLHNHETDKTPLRVEFVALFDRIRHEYQCIIVRLVTRSWMSHTSRHYRPLADRWSAA
jgi:hypothetical protein